MFKTHPLYEKAQLQTKAWMQNEMDLIATLREIEETKVYKLVGFNSMHELCTLGLKLSDGQAYTLIGVSRKCAELPELKAAIDLGKFSPAKARKMLSVIDKQNSMEWIERAATLSERQLEKEVAKARPQTSIREKVRPVAENLNQFECGIDDETESLVNACRDLVSKRLGKAVGWNEMLKVLAREYKFRHDPVEKAERAKVRDLKKPRQLFPGTVGGRSKPARVFHEVSLRDRDECQEMTPRGRCRSRRFTQIHHIRPVALGGETCSDNLITLCSLHHALRHGDVGSKFKRAN